MSSAHALSHPTRSATAIAVAAIFLAGLTAGAWLAPIAKQATARAATSPAAHDQDNAPVVPASRTGYPAHVLRVFDGDTFEARVNAWPGLEVSTKVRLRGVDAPELRSARCAGELAKAQAARDALAAILTEGAVAVSHVTLDKYGGRVVADASTRSTADVAAALLRAGHVRPYGGGKREGWCGGTGG